MRALYVALTRATKLLDAACTRATCPTCLGRSACRGAAARRLDDRAVAHGQAVRR